MSFKHGSCQSKSLTEYYILSINLLKKINDSSFGQYIESNIRKKIALVDLHDNSNKSFGANSDKSLMLTCYKDKIVGIGIRLKKNVSNTDIEDLILPYPKDLQNACPTYVSF